MHGPSSFVYAERPPTGFVSSNADLGEHKYIHEHDICNINVPKCGLEVPYQLTYYSILCRSGLASGEMRTGWKMLITCMSFVTSR